MENLMGEEQHLARLKERKLKCPECDNVWNTSSKKKRWVTCSNRECKHKVDSEKYQSSEKISERKKRVC